MILVQLPYFLKFQRKLDLVMNNERILYASKLILENVNTLSFSAKNLTSFPDIVKDGNVDISCVTSIDLKKNRLTHGLFKLVPFTELKRLNIGDNYFTDLDFAESETKLEQLHAFANRIDVFGENLVTKLKNLTILNLNRNFIEKLPSNINLLENLQKLSLKECFSNFFLKPW